MFAAQLDAPGVLSVTDSTSLREVIGRVFEEHVVTNLLDVPMIGRPGQICDHLCFVPLDTAKGLQCSCASPIEWPKSWPAVPPSRDPRDHHGNLFPGRSPVGQGFHPETERGGVS